MDLDAMYRAQSRFGDPMAAYVKQRQPTEPLPIALPGSGKHKKGRASHPLLLILMPSVVVFGPAMCILSQVILQL